MLRAEGSSVRHDSTRDNLRQVDPEYPSSTVLGGRYRLVYSIFFVHLPEEEEDAIEGIAVPAKEEVDIFLVRAE